mgnify:CR=1 FL=1
MIFGDDTARCWKQIIYFNSVDEEEQADTTPAAKPAAPALEEVFDADHTLVRDERGVRLARDVEEEAD